MILDRLGIRLPEYYKSLSYIKKRLVVEEYKKIQNFKCYYCGNHLYAEPAFDVQDKKIDWRLFPPNFLKYKNHLHHDHKTGLTIGVVHAYCNAVLWQYHGE